MARLTARSAVTASQVGRCASGVSAAIKSTRSALISIPNAPWPAAGSMWTGSKKLAMRAPSPRRFSPAAASTMAAYWPSSSLCRRVSRLPRRGSIFRSGRSARSNTLRRKLDVPTTAPGGSSASDAYWFDTKASRGSSRAITQARLKPSGKSMGTSLRECTAMSARPSSSATSSSLTKRPLPPTLLRERSKIWSPRVVMPNSVTLCPLRNSKALTCSACQSAKRLSRVAITKLGLSGEPEGGSEDGFKVVTCC